MTVYDSFGSPICCKAGGYRVSIRLMKSEPDGLYLPKDSAEQLSINLAAYTRLLFPVNQPRRAKDMVQRVRDRARASDSSLRARSWASDLPMEPHSISIWKTSPFESWSSNSASPRCDRASTLM